MFDIGFWELLVIALLGLIILGPERLPRAIRTVQRGVQRMRQFGSQMEAELNHELRIKELHENLKKIESADDLENLPDDLKKSLTELQRAAASVQAPYAKDKTAGQGNKPDKPRSDTQDPSNES